MTNFVLVVFVYLFNRPIALYNYIIKFGTIGENDVVIFFEYYWIRNFMCNPFHVIFRKRILHLITARHKCLETAARTPREEQSYMQRKLNVYEARCLRDLEKFIKYIKSMPSREKTTLQSVRHCSKGGSECKTEFNVSRVYTIRSNRGQHSSEKEFITIRQFLEHALISKDFSKATAVAFQKKESLPADNSLIFAKNMPKTRAKSYAINDMNLTSLNSYATEGKKHVLERYPLRRPLEIPIIASSKFPGNSLIYTVLSLRFYMDLVLKINYLQSLAFTVKRCLRNNWNGLVAYKSLTESFASFLNDKKYNINCCKLVSEFFYAPPRDQSNNLKDNDKYKKRGPDRITTTAKGKERNTKSLNKRIKRLVLSFVFTSLAFTRYHGEFDIFYQSSVRHDSVSYRSGKCFDFGKASIAPVEEFYGKGKDTMFSSYWLPYSHNDPCFVYTLHAQTTNATQDDASATDSRQVQEEINVTVTEINATEESHLESGAIGPILDGIPRRAALPSQIDEGENQLEWVSLSRRPRSSTDSDRGSGTNAVHSSVEHDANIIVEDETDFGLHLWDNGASARNNTRQRTGQSAVGLPAANYGKENSQGITLPRRLSISTAVDRGNGTTTVESSGDHFANIVEEDETSFASEPYSINLWDNEASARINRSQRTGQSAGVLGAVSSRTENSQGAFSTFPLVTGDTLNPELHVDLNDAITLRVAGNAAEIFPLIDIDVNRRQDRVLMELISTSEKDEQSIGILDSTIIIRQQGDVHEMVNFEQEDIIIHPSQDEG
ncbi:unnamed protein product [Lymnaea stagnalis]|uniref:Uncharacterized protein n=1 Tax=Lymnaea stagnalis TaxID=6523 RepID=A0AAV2IE25_LYMST